MQTVVLENLVDQLGSEGIFYSYERVFSRTLIECHLARIEPRVRTVLAVRTVLQEAGETDAGRAAWLLSMTQA